jgi:serine/threonine protein kinase
LQVYRWSLDILSALEHLHGLDPVVMHRDIKPANILVTRDHRTLKLADFGLATRCRRTADAAKEKHACNVGTPRYTAPEVLQRLHDGDAATASAIYTEKADVYSAALVIWYMLTGWEPACDVRRSPRARPDAQSAVRRWPQMAALLERMWSHEADARPAAAECAGADRLLPLSRVSGSPGACGPQPACAVQ